MTELPLTYIEFLAMCGPETHPARDALLIAERLKRCRFLLSGDTLTMEGDE